MSGRCQKRGGLRKNEGTEILCNFRDKGMFIICFIYAFVRILQRYWRNTCLFFDHTKGDICDVVMYIIAQTYVFWGITGQAKVSNTHAIFFKTFYLCIIWCFCIFFVHAKCVMFETVLYTSSRGWSAYWVFSTEHAALHWFFPPTLSTTLGWCHEWMFYGVIK